MRTRLKNCCLQIVIIIGLLAPIGEVFAASDVGVPDYVQRYLDLHHPLPDDVTYNAWLQSQGSKLSPKEEMASWVAWKKGQRPIISLSDLVALEKAQIKSIHSAFLQYETTDIKMKPGGILQRSDTCHYKWWILGSKLRLDIDQSDIKLSTKRSYDGNVEYYVDFPNGTNARGLIQNFTAFAPYYKPNWSPWVAQMLVDSQQVWGMQRITHDVILYLTFEAKMATVEDCDAVVDGHKTIIVAFGTPPVFKIWLDPQANYAVIQFAETPVITTADRHIWLGPIDCLRHSKDLKDRGDGIFLPDEIIEEYFASARDTVDGFKIGDVTNRHIAKLTGASVNGQINEKIFTNIFPDGTNVYNLNTRIGYIVGVPANSMEDMIGAAVTQAKTNSNSTDHNTSNFWVLTGIIMIGCFLCLSSIFWLIFRLRHRAA